MVKNKRAFTFIELLVSVSIIILFSGIVLAYYNRQSAEKILSGDADALVDVLELAKKKATSGDVGNQLNCDFKGYNLTFAASTYSLNLLCASAVPISNYSLSKTVTFSPLPVKITFLPLTGSNNSVQTVVITEAASGKSITITVANGNISR